MRVSTACKRLLRLPGAGVADVSFTNEGVVVTVGLRRRPEPVKPGETLRVRD